MINQKTCCICLDDLVKNDKNNIYHLDKFDSNEKIEIACLNCEHHYHLECIYKYIQFKMMYWIDLYAERYNTKDVNSNDIKNILKTIKCPLCRKRINITLTCDIVSKYYNILKQKYKIIKKHLMYLHMFHLYICTKYRFANKMNRPYILDKCLDIENKYNDLVCVKYKYRRLIKECENTIYNKICYFEYMDNIQLRWMSFRYKR
jgi:hypothetical protein